MSKKRKLAGASIFAHLPPDLRSSIRAQKFAAVEAPSQAVTANTAEVHDEVDVQQPAASTSRVRIPISQSLLDQNVQHPWDCNGLVPRYSHASQVPERLKKYWHQRKQLFSLYDDAPILMDETGWYSVTPEAIAEHTAERCRSDTILDGFCGVGGNAIQFALTCERVIAIDSDMTRLRLARHNAMQYGVADRIEFICADYIQFADAYASRLSSEEGPIDVVFLSPPWGGPEYQSAPVADLATREGCSTSAPSTAYPLAALGPVSGQELFRLSRALTPNVALFLPRNVDVNEVASLAPVSSDGQQDLVEIEESWVGSEDHARLKACTAYFGALTA